MKWKLSTTGSFYGDKDKIQLLMMFGFEFEKSGVHLEGCDLYMTTDYIEVDIISLKDIQKYEDFFDCNLIVSFRNKTIEIYDSCRE